MTALKWLQILPTRTFDSLPAFDAFSKCPLKLQFCRERIYDLLRIFNMQQLIRQQLLQQVRQLQPLLQKRQRMNLCQDEIYLHHRHPSNTLRLCRPHLNRRLTATLMVIVFANLYSFSAVEKSLFTGFRYKTTISGIKIIGQQAMLKELVSTVAESCIHARPYQRIPIQS